MRFPKENFSKVGLYCIIAAFLMSGTKLQHAPDRGALIAELIGAFLGSFAVVAVIGEIILAVRRSIRKRRDRKISN